MTLFKELKISQSHLIGNKDQKKLSSLFNSEQAENLFSKEKIYRINKCKGKISVYSCSNEPIFFIIANYKPAPVLKYLIKYPIMANHTVFLDSGAFKPIMQGANIMAPGIYKYKEMIKSPFMMNDIVCIYIINDGFIAIGIAKIDFNIINENTKGVVIEIIHRKEDALDELEIN
ncbi:Translation machinery-associated protein 20 [Astathelohania contejeani]|uniref:Translation machinery-associated protein 20 n=1 Tax=Astathelohania contejeani TaxID=164912 RepID=A0ABQ7HZQ1_9MICR|nr:Translation machinery-associated protein 20 [Thelohania contejeani]